MKELKERETNPDEGKIFAYVYTQKDDHFDIQTEAFAKFQGKTVSALEIQMKYICCYVN